VEPQSELKLICADAGQMEQLVMNLAANARDAMPHGGRMVMETANFEITPEFAAAHPGAHPGRRPGSSA
jgi:hypothetical protein